MSFRALMLVLEICRKEMTYDIKIDQIDVKQPTAAHVFVVVLLGLHEQSPIIKLLYFAFIFYLVIIVF